MSHRNKIYASLKICKKQRAYDYSRESEIYNILGRGSWTHPGRNYIRTARDSFKIPRPEGNHWCLVQEPMYDSMKNFLARVPDRRLPLDILRMSLVQIFVALDYAYTQCRLVHTG
jgi:serine/threonine-protein kinase SRPK3